MSLRSSFILMIVATSLLVAQQKKGQISGQIIDAASEEPLIGVNVVLVEKPSIGISTDVKGNFFLSNIDVGEYSLRASIIGYEPVVVTNVVVSTGRSTKVKIKLQQTTLQMEGVNVQADYFRKAGALSTISTTSLDAAEIRRSPGSAQDMQRIVQNLPGVSNSTDQRNDLIVRGGAPNENLTVMDYIEIPSTNHYPSQFNSGGPINMVNVDLIEDIQFSTGGFPVQYGDKMSSVMNVALREGDRRRHFASNTGLNFAGFGTVMEGKLNEGKGSWIVSLRQSFLETLDKIIGISSLGITAIPKYWDAQVKVVYDLSSTQKLLLSGIYGNDKIFMSGTLKETNLQKAGISDSVGVSNIDFKSQQYAYGLSLKSLWGTKGFSVLTLSALGNIYDASGRSDYTFRRYDAGGNLVQSNIIDSRQTFQNKSTEAILGLKYEMVYQLHPRHELSFGAQYQTVRNFDNSVRFDADTARYDLNNDGIFELGPITFPGGLIENHLKLGDSYKLYGYISDKMRLSPLLTLIVGLRYDYFQYSKQGNLSPRASLTYELIPPTTHLTAAYGEYYQTQSLPLYADNRNIGYNRELKNSHARHFVLGFDHLFDEGLKGSIEGYYKEYFDLPIREQFIYSANNAFRSDKNLNVGKRRSYGMEIFLQQKQVKDFYGTLSYSYSKTEELDPRIPQLVNAYPSNYDYPNVLTLVVGKTMKNTRTSLDNAPFFIKYPSYLLPFSDDMEISLRFRYQSGNPYTPKVYATNEQHREGGRAWSRGWWVDGTAVNSARYPDYHRLDLQWISRYHFSTYNIEVLFLLENVYNRANVFLVNYRSDGTTETVYQFSFFPVIGVGIEF